MADAVLALLRGGRGGASTRTRPALPSARRSGTLCPAGADPRHRHADLPERPSRHRPSRPPRSEPEVRNGVVVNAEETILGADNKAAVAAMVAAVEQAGGRRHRPRGHRAGADADGGGWPARCQSSSTSAVCKPHSGTATTTRRRSGTSSWPPPHSAPCACTSTAGRRTRGSPRSRGEARSPPRRAPSPTCGWAGSTRQTTANVGLIRGRRCRQHRASRVHGHGRRPAAATPTGCGEWSGDARRRHPRRQPVRVPSSRSRSSPSTRATGLSRSHPAVRMVHSGTGRARPYTGVTWSRAAARMPTSSTQRGCRA